MYNYTYTPVTFKVVCTILYSPETSLQWAAPHLTLDHGFPIIRLSQPKKIAGLNRIKTGLNRIKQLEVLLQECNVRLETKITKR